jgi:hypothetical protein
MQRSFPKEIYQPATIRRTAANIRSLSIWGRHDRSPM